MFLLNVWIELDCVSIMLINIIRKNTNENVDSLSNIQLPNNSITNIKDYILRDCQKKALEVIKNDDISRIKMACGTGKSLVVIDYILDHPGNYLLLVPYLILQNQWNVLCQKYGLRT